MSTPILVISGTPTKQDADALADQAMKQKLAAAVQIIGPVESRYRWKEQIHKAEEWICQFKTSEQLYPKLEALIQELHPYELPGILVIPIIGGSTTYLKWYHEQLITHREAA